MATFFNEYFGIDAETLDSYGALNISIINDLPLFIDPFLLFNSEKDEYRALHDAMIDYLVFLRDRSARGPVSDALLSSWYCFGEVKQNWLGFSISGNGGTGLGMDFARALHSNLHSLFSDFGEEKITEGSHLEKVCLISDGVGRDNISDFTTNLIKDYLCRYTEQFAAQHLKPSDVRQVAVGKTRFKYETETWERATYALPWVNGDFVILTPKDILTRDENWINKGDLVGDFQNIPTAISDSQLRAQVENYFHKILDRPGRRRHSSAKERSEAARRTLLEFPQLIDYYIKLKEQHGDDAADLSAEKVLATEYMFIRQIADIQKTLLRETAFYGTSGGAYEEAHARVGYLKDVIENKGGHRLFYHDGAPVQREKDLQILYRLVWFGTPSDVGTEANDGRGPVDFKISRGAHDKTLVEMKLAKNTQLERNLEKQVPIYQAASDAQNAIKVILYFSVAELRKVNTILKKLDLADNKDIVLIDARDDNKPSGSKA
ncbi:hypothetical protein IVB27_30010 [Bradyrhizobium sp. 197]|uniref:hypothetical protein n=1 Tax=Bradyrhizobium sp. 197 TaxID=2782663 RepID=UPI001FF9B547|nr:hypothetical protein [Bradyrhizobium sp. 197]MCK1478867.1 hypothetical protein [Bradyrhizobium sp. 197]